MAATKCAWALLHAPAPPLDLSQHTPVGSLAAVTWNRRWWIASRLSPPGLSSSTTSPPQGVSTRQRGATWVGLREGRSAPWRCASAGWVETLMGTVWRRRVRVRREEKLLGGGRGKGASDDELLEATQRLPIPPPRQHRRHLPCVQD